MTKPSSGARRGWVHPAMALSLAGVYLAVVVPQAARGYPSDDTTLLVPTHQRKRDAPVRRWTWGDASLGRGNPHSADRRQRTP
ncbi:MAG: hypothetical protein A2X52_17100 [Candidatus Rokubacteria bacterium GWC2_70_16]|nr:MAG: hypothetical protein A2X52_17100 [Candidatus Rokubacteria bacterium GWC2_70_16]